MLRLRLRPEASAMVVSISATAATSVRSMTTSVSGNTLTATMPLSHVSSAASSSSSALVRRVHNSHFHHRKMNALVGSSATFSVPLSTIEQFRFVRAKPSSSSEADAKADTSAEEKATRAEGAKTEENKTNEGEEAKTNEEGEEAKKEGEGDASKKKKKTQEKKSFREQFQSLKQDMKDFPDIYNSVNLVHFFIFTIFCLCSTGSNVEEQWWLNNWGIDKSFAPWAWPLHSLLTNNFLSMTFAMLLLHSMCHSAMVSLGPRLMWQYMAAVAVTSGFLMWGLNATMGWSHEKQFGPWDVCSALFVMQYLHTGMKPWQLILSFNGWVKYAMCVGSVCILYYDWQPVMFGTVLGLALCKIHPKLRSIKPPQ